VSPRHDTLESLLSRIRLLTTDLCKAHRIKHELDIAEDAAGHSVAEEVRRGLYLIMKEAITNAARHAQAATITVHARVEQDYLHMSVADDGKGLETGHSDDRPTKRGHGLRNMKKRAEEIRAELSIESTPGKGTSVRLRMRMTQTGH
jgi:signal transduction histidine kinase